MYVNFRNKDGYHNVKELLFVTRKIERFSVLNKTYVWTWTSQQRINVFKRNVTESWY